VGNIGPLVVGVVLAVLAGGWIAVGRLATPPLLGWAAVGALGFTAAGWVLERTARAGTDTLGRGAADLTVFAGVLIGLVGAALVSGVAVLIGLGALAVMIVHSRVLERNGPPVNLALAALAGLPFVYGALAVGRTSGALVPCILAAWLQFLRATVAELETESVVRMGRSRAAMRSAVLALGFIPVSLILPARAGYGGAYFLLAVFAQLAVLVTAARLIVGRTDGLSVLLKGAMVMGGVALVAGRVTWRG
jgi:4-hydroxybenzoate polyprenyltransferase